MNAFQLRLDLITFRALIAVRFESQVMPLRLRIRYSSVDEALPNPHL